MSTLQRKRRLWDAYRFAGFRPEATVRGIFGDPKARVITLVRRAKKHTAVPAGLHNRAGTTGDGGGFAISRAPIRVSIWTSRYAGSTAETAGR